LEIIVNWKKHKNLQQKKIIKCAKMQEKHPHDHVMIDYLLTTITINLFGGFTWLYQSYQ